MCDLCMIIMCDLCISFLEVFYSTILCLHTIATYIQCSILPILRFYYEIDDTLFILCMTNHKYLNISHTVLWVLNMSPLFMLIDQHSPIKIVPIIFSCHIITLFSYIFTTVFSPCRMGVTIQHCPKSLCHGCQALH